MMGAEPASTRIPLEAYLLAVSVFLVVAATNIITPLLPDIRADFGVSIATAGIIVGSYGLARLLTDLPAGLVIDALGHRAVTIAGLIVLVLASILGLNASSVPMLIAARVGSGVAVALVTTVALAGLGGIATPANRGKVMSLCPTSADRRSPASAERCRRVPITVPGRSARAGH